MARPFLILSPHLSSVVRKLRKTEILKFAECCKFTTAADLSFQDMNNFAFLSFELRLSRVSCVVSGLARINPRVSVLTFTQRNESYQLERHIPYQRKVFSSFQFLRSKEGEIISRFSLIMSVTLGRLSIQNINFSYPVVIIKFCCLYCVISEIIVSITKCSNMIGC